MYYFIILSILFFVFLAVNFISYLYFLFMFFVFYIFNSKFIQPLFYNKNLINNKKMEIEFNQIKNE